MTLQSFLMDGLSRAAFFSPIMAYNEYFLAGMETEEVMKARLYAVGINLVIGKPYALYREWFTKRLHTDENSSALRKTFVDSTGFILS